jgi:hypothetical protein
MHLTPNFNLMYIFWAEEEMPKEYTERSLIEFQKSFPDEEACAKHLGEQRWPDGFMCPSCGHGEQWYLVKRKLFDCKNCPLQTSIAA